MKGLENLTKLQLDNNIIYKIQNLDHLVHLTWLDLSFNQIEKVENLDNLVNLTDLTLYSNKIRFVSGLEKLNQLNVLSLGNNLIKNYNGEDGIVPYLRSLNNKLEVLTLMGNDCAKHNAFEYKYYTVAFLEKLKYLDYELIDKSLRI